MNKFQNIPYTLLCVNAVKHPHQNLRLPHFQTLEWLDTQNVSFAVYHSTYYASGHGLQSLVQSTGDSIPGTRICTAWRHTRLLVLVCVWCVVCSPIIYQETDERGEGLTRHGVAILN